MGRSEEIISLANPHTIKKFELIEKYVEAWAHILLLNPYCMGLVFIDCMSNSGEYVDDDGNHVFGTLVRVAKYLRQVAGQYFGKQIDLCFSDLSAEKTAHLNGLLPKDDMKLLYESCLQLGLISDSTQWSAFVSRQINSWKKRVSA